MNVRSIKNTENLFTQSTFSKYEYYPLLVYSQPIRGLKRKVPWMRLIYLPMLYELIFSFSPIVKNYFRC